MIKLPRKLAFFCLDDRKLRKLVAAILVAKHQEPDGVKALSEWALGRRWQVLGAEGKIEFYLACAPDGTGPNFVLDDNEYERLEVLIDLLAVPDRW